MYFGFLIFDFAGIARGCTRIPALIYRSVGDFPHTGNKIKNQRKSALKSATISGLLPQIANQNSKIKNILCLLSCVLCLMTAGCGEDSPFESQDSVPVKTPRSLSALDFPTADGCSWEYISVDGEHTYTLKVAGTRNVGGFAARIMESDSDVPVDQLASLYGFPTRTSLFTKDLDSYTEHAFELWLDFLNDTFFQRNSPKRILWSFPLYVGKEWTVSKSRLVPEITYTRKVVSDNIILTVPAGTFRGVYCVEEYASIPDLPIDEETPNKYWLAPDVGVIKYEYLDFISNTTDTYELIEFRKGR